MNDKRLELAEKIREDTKQGKVVWRVNGVFGELPGSDGYGQVVQDNGTKIKIYGCSFLFKGFTHQDKVFGMEFAKSILFGFPQLLLFKSWIYTLAVGFKFLLFRKRFIYDLDWLFEEVRYKCLRHYDIPDKEYNEFGREFKRASAKVLKDQFDIRLDTPFYRPGNEKFREEGPKDVRLLRVYPDPRDVKGQIGWLIARVLKFVVFFLEHDTAYRFRVQDAFGMGHRDIFKLLEVLIHREQRKLGVRWKWIFIRKALKVFFFFEPRVKKFIDAFLKELDYSKVKMDESDKYFSLAYHSYNFGGRNLRDRLAEKKRIDESKGHVFLIGIPVYEYSKEYKLT